MKNLAIQALVAVGIVLAWQLLAGTAAPPPAADQESLDVRYARAQLQLAETNLRKVRQMNQRTAGTVPAEVVVEFRQDVEVAQQRLQEAIRGESDSFQAWLHRAESLARSAELQWRNALAANQRTPGTIDATDVERFRLRFEVASLEYQRGQALIGRPREVQLQWQISLLEDQLQRLNREVLRKPPATRYYPLWWY